MRRIVFTAMVLIQVTIYGRSVKDISKLVNVKVSNILGDEIETDADQPILTGKEEIDRDLEILFDNVPKIEKANINTTSDIIKIVQFVDVKVSLDEFEETVTQRIPNDITDTLINKPIIDNHTQKPTITSEKPVKKVTLDEYGKPGILKSDVKNPSSEKPLLKVNKPEQTTRKDELFTNIPSLNPIIDKPATNEDVSEELSPCVKKGEAHKGSNLPDGYPIKELRTEANLCWKMCQETEECEFWTWVSDSYNGKNPKFWRGMCYLKRRQSKTPTSITGFIAGTKTCSPFI